MKVRVYRNLHKHCYSVKAQEGPMKGLVIAHKNEVVLTDVTLKVSEKSRQRVLREGRKNVHAFVEGSIDPYYIEQKTSYIDGLEVSDDFIEASYNPYEHGFFYRIDDHQPLYTAKQCILCDTGMFVL